MNDFYSNRASSLEPQGEPLDSPVSSGAASRASPGAAASAVSLDFDAVYATHFDFVWRSVRRLGIDPTTANDVVQEVFVVVHQRLPEFEQQASLKSWLFAIVINLVRHAYRTRQRKEPYRGAEQDPDTLADAAQPGPLEAVERSHRLRLLDQLLQSLDQDKREVFVLAELEQLTALEISEALGVVPNTVYSRLRVAREEFQAALKRHRARESGRRS